MATVINNPDHSGSDSGVGLIVGILIAVVVIFLFFFYGLPAMRNNQAAPSDGSIDVNVDMPDNTFSPNPAPTSPSAAPGSSTSTTTTTTY